VNLTKEDNRPYIGRIGCIPANRIVLQTFVFSAKLFASGSVSIPRCGPAVA
jgi:hypothetical protein